VTINLSYLLRTKKLFKKYQAHTASPKFEFAEYIPEIQALFKGASIKDQRFPDVTLAGYGYVTTGTYSCFDNIFLMDERVVAGITVMFYSTIGVFKRRLFESFNPLYWILFIVYLPKNILGYFGIPPEKTIVKIFQIIYWIVATSVSVLSILSKKEIQDFLINLLKQ
jgi:hypothetical protein